MEIASGYVEGKLGAVKYTLENEQILGNYLLDVVCNVYLIIIKLYLSLNSLILVGKLRKIQDSFEIKRIISVYVNMEEGVLKVVEDLLVKIGIFFL